MLLALLRTLIFLYFRVNTMMIIKSSSSEDYLNIVKLGFTVGMYFEKDLSSIVLETIFTPKVFKTIFKFYYKAYKQNIPIQYKRG